MNLFGYDLVLLLNKDLFSLADGWKGWGNIELVDHDAWVDPKHIFMAPSEDVQVVP